MLFRSDGDVMRCVADLDGMRAEVARISPEDAPNFDRFIEASADIYEVAFKELADFPFHKFSSVIAAAPDLVRLRGYRSVYSEVCRYFKNPKLRVAFSFHPLLIGGNPLTTTAYYCLISHLERMHLVHFAMGGTGSIARGMVKLIERKGGLMRYGEEVEEILTEQGAARGVRLKSGEEITADLVVSNADPAWTYSKLLKNYPRRRWTEDRKSTRLNSSH